MVLPASEVAQYRRALRDVNTLAQRDLLAQWRAFDLADAAQVTAGLLDTLPALVDGYFVVASTVAADWYDVVRAQAGARRRFAAIPADPPDVSRAEALARWAVGPLFSGDPKPDVALSKLAGGLQRVVTTGARETVRVSSIQDPSAAGWKRVTSSGSCDFCQMLAGRDVLYSEAASDFASHDFCNCDAVPEFGGESRSVREYTASTRFKTQAARDANNKAVRNYLNS